MLMGAARNALWAFNARVSLTCLYVIARGLPRLLCGSVWIARSQGRSWRTGRMARYRTECIRLPYTAPVASHRAFFVKEHGASLPDRWDREREKKPAPLVLDRQYLEVRHNAVNQLRFKPEPHIFIDIQVCIPVFILQRPGGKSPDVILIVSDHGGKGAIVTVHGCQDHRHRDRYRQPEYRSSSRKYASRSEQPCCHCRCHRRPQSCRNPSWRCR